MYARKSQGVSFLLTFFFGPLGLLYSSVVGGVILTISAFVVGMFTFGVGALLLWPVAIVWGAAATSSFNSNQAHAERIDAEHAQYQHDLAVWQATTIARAGGLK